VFVVVDSGFTRIIQSSYAKIRIYGIRFDLDRAHIEPCSETVIAGIADYIGAPLSPSFQVQGHTDADGRAPTTARSGSGSGGRRSTVWSLTMGSRSGREKRLTGGADSATVPGMDVRCMAMAMCAAREGRCRSSSP
jgi:hypothetical protein